MADASPSVPIDVDAVDLTEGDGVAAGMGGVADAADTTTGPTPAAPPPAGSGEVDVADLAPALNAAGIGVDGEPAPEGSTVTPETGEAARSGKAVDLALGVVRLGVGVALVAAPGWAGRIWVGPGADGPGSLVFARALGARDVALGLRILDGVRKGEPVRHWVVAGFAADAADVAATVIAGRHLTPNRRIAMPLIAGAVGALGVVSSRRA